MKLNVYSNISKHRANPWLYLILAIYAFVLFYFVINHELWVDEIHSWNIAKASHSVFDLISNSKYEGHPPLWYFLLFLITKFSHNPFYMQMLHVCICCSVIFLILFYSNFSIPVKLFIIFGYYFIYEYATLSRNYSIGILFAFMICMLLSGKYKYKVLAYYVVLFLLSNTHLLGVLLAISFHYYFILTHKIGKRVTVLHVLLGLLVLLPSIYFIYPPSNSSLNGNLWLTFFNKTQYFVLQNAPVRSLFPVPAWWEFNLWNTQCLINSETDHFVKNLFLLFLSISLISCLIFIIKENRKILIFFLVNLLLTLSFALFFPLTSQRYVGFIYISFIVSLWLFNKTSFVHIKTLMIYLLLAIQIPAAMIFLKRDISEPFSQINKISKMVELIPLNQNVITDFWCLNYATAALDKPVYCIGFDKEKEFLQWDKQTIEITRQKDLYLKGINSYLQKIKYNECYFISTTQLTDLIKNNNSLTETYDIMIVAQEVGAIEKYSNLYLYKFMSRNK